MHFYFRSAHFFFGVWAFFIEVCCFFLEVRCFFLEVYIFSVKVRIFSLALERRLDKDHEKTTNSAEAWIYRNCQRVLNQLQYNTIQNF